MNARFNRPYSVLIAVLIALCFSVPAAAQIGTEFTYQGQISVSGVPHTGALDFEFQLYDQAGNPVGPAIQRNDVPTTNGLFTVRLDFGPAFTGARRFLEIRVSQDISTTPYTILTPRQELTPSPYAMWATGAGNAATATMASDSQLLDGQDSTAFALAGHTHAASTITGVGNGEVVFGTGTGLAGDPGQFMYDSGANNLTVANDIRADGVYRIGPDSVLRIDNARNNTFVGISGNSAITSVNNTSVGDGALTAAGAADGNTAVGASALAVNARVPADAAHLSSGNTAVGAGSLAANTKGFANVAVGANSLAANTQGYFNTAIGATALDALNSPTAAGNTAVGYNALGSSTSTIDATAVGANALAANLANGNTAVGSNAMISNTLGGDNTAVGVNALRTNVGTGTDGWRNVAVGTAALRSNNLGNDNIAVGPLALQTNIDGDRNTAVGASALGNTFGANDNTAYGAYTLDNLGAGNNNTALGSEALTTLADASDNTAVGRRALATLTGSAGSALRNVAVGALAGQVNLSGSDNIYIGYNAASSHVGTESNNIVIGNPGSGGDNNRIRIGNTSHNNTRITGIFGTTINAGGIPVYIDGNHQLGTVLSSGRYKENVRDMGSYLDQLLALRPVVFNYRKEVLPEGRPQTDEYGLIAEEVEQVNPDWVARDNDGTIISVRYDQVNAALLGLVQKQQSEIEQQQSEIDQLQTLVRDMAKRLARIESEGRK